MRLINLFVVNFAVVLIAREKYEKFIRPIKRSVSLLRSIAEAASTSN